MRRLVTCAWFNDLFASGKENSASMKQVIASRTLRIPDGVDILVRARQVRVKGPRGAPALYSMQ